MLDTGDYHSYLSPNHNMSLYRLSFTENTNKISEIIPNYQMQYMLTYRSGILDFGNSGYALLINRKLFDMFRR